jgi:predicted enzyme related to lactoylglutathione lyase
MHGQFVWYELTTPDVDAARKFYSPITGWGTQPFDKDYTMWTTGGVPFAGIFRLGPEQRAKGIPPHWMPYIEADGVDDTARRATSIGGKILHGPEDIPGAGRFAVLQDPQGAAFGIYKSVRASQGWDGTPVRGRFSWHELMTTDFRKAFDFYRQLFGWDESGEMDMGDGSRYFMFGGRGKMFGGMFNRPPEMSGMSPFWLMYVDVENVEKAVDAATRAGGFVQRAPTDIPGGRIAILGDSQGAGFAVISLSAVAPEKPAARKKSAATRRPKASLKRRGKTTAAASRPKAKAKAAARKKSPAKKSSRKAASKRRSPMKARPKARPKAKPKARPKAKRARRTR